MGMISPGSRKLGLRNPAVLAGLAIFGVFGVFWVFLILPIMTSNPSFYTLNPIIAYPLYNVGFIFLSVGAFGYLFGGIVLGQRFNIINALKIGLVSFGLFSGVFDLIQPPLYLSPSGQVLIPLGTSSLESVAVDAAVAEIYKDLFPFVVGTPTWYYLTYLITPVIIILFSAIILTPKQFIFRLRQGGL